MILRLGNYLAGVQTEQVGPSQTKVVLTAVFCNLPTAGL
jgi:hypothetical protein